ncbi:MAG: hypothetical protein K8L97_11870 [Anaerolineae bacterium]|nr:hypothetical protein [Anaerolineae bacterium]
MSNDSMLSRRVRSTCRPPRRDRSTKQHCCVSVDKPPERPDPATYSQAEQLSLGNAPSWNSPDIVTNNWSPWRLMQEPEVIVRNLSPTASAINTLVHFYWSPFGIGMPRTLLTTRMINLPASAQTTLKFPLGQDTLNGPQEIGTYIVIEHPHDQNLINSKGDQIHFGALTSESGRNLEFTLPVRNPSGQAQQITLTVLSNDFGAVVAPAAPTIAAFAQVNTQVTMAVPNTLHGTSANQIQREVTIIGRGADGQVIDGVTFVIRIDD